MDAARLKKIEMFASLADEDLEGLAAVAKEKHYDKGEKIIRVETWPHDLYAIESGTVEVTRDGELIARLGAGDVVGETGVVKRALRNADVSAAQPRGRRLLPHE